MRKIFLLTCLALTLGLSSCQCSDKPNIGPVEGETLASNLESTLVIRPSTLVIRQLVLPLYPT